MRAVSSGTGGTGCGRRSDMDDLPTRDHPTPEPRTTLPISPTVSDDFRTNSRTLRVQGLTLCEIYMRSYRRFWPTADWPTGQSDYRLPWRSSINAITAAITFSSSAIL